MRDAMFCDHANEMPSGGCPCDPECYCRHEGSCAEGRINKNAWKESWQPPKNSSHKRVGQGFRVGNTMFVTYPDEYIEIVDKNGQKIEVMLDDLLFFAADYVRKKRIEKLNQLSVNDILNIGD